MKRMIGTKSLILFLGICFSPWIALAADPQIELNPRKITVGDPIDVTISIPVPPGKKVVFPTAENFSPAELMHIDTIETNAAHPTLRYTISLFEPGEQDLPDLPVIIMDGDESDTLWLDPGRIEVESVVANPDTSTIRDIRPPVKLAWTFKELLPYLIGALAGLIITAGLIYWWKKRRRERGGIPEYVPPPIPADVLAMRRLEELRVKHLWQDGHPKEYHSELTDILKEYIGSSHHFNALEMTSEELLLARSKWTTDDELFGMIRRILNLADLVKFAKLSPLPHDHEKSLELAFSYVQTTRPKHEPNLSEAA